jgi:hypothetical protein
MFDNIQFDLSNYFDGLLHTGENRYVFSCTNEA